MIVEIPARGNPVAVFFPRPSRAIAAYRDGYAVVEMGEKAALHGWRAIRLPNQGAIARVREGCEWRGRIPGRFAASPRICGGRSSPPRGRS